MHPPLVVMYFCIHNCTSPSNDYAAVACSNNNQAVTHSCISSLLISGRLASLKLLRDIQFGLPANSLASYIQDSPHMSSCSIPFIIEVGVAIKLSGALHALVTEPPFLNF